MKIAKLKLPKMYAKRQDKIITNIFNIKNITPKNYFLFSLIMKRIGTPLKPCSFLI